MSGLLQRLAGQALGAQTSGAPRIRPAAWRACAGASELPRDGDGAPADAAAGLEPTVGADPERHYRKNWQRNVRPICRRAHRSRPPHRTDSPSHRSAGTSPHSRRARTIAQARARTRFMQTRRQRPCSRRCSSPARRLRSHPSLRQPPPAASRAERLASRAHRSARAHRPHRSDRGARTGSAEEESRHARRATHCRSLTTWRDGGVREHRARHRRRHAGAARPAERPLRESERRRPDRPERHREHHAAGQGGAAERRRSDATQSFHAAGHAQPRLAQRRPAVARRLGANAPQQSAAGHQPALPDLGLRRRRPARRDPARSRHAAAAREPRDSARGHSHRAAAAARPGGHLPPWLRALRDSGLQDQIEQLRITPEFLSTEDMSKFWTVDAGALPAERRV